MSIHILVLTSDPEEVNLLKAALQHSRKRFTIEWLTLLSSGIRHLKSSDIDAVIVNLSLPDSSGIATFEKLLEVVPQTPILALSPADLTAADKAMMEHRASILVPQPKGANADLQYETFAETLPDIAHLNHLQESSHSEKQRAEIILNSIQDAVICTDLSGKIVYLNPSAEKMTGWSKEDADGRHINEVFNIVDGLTHAPPADNPVYSVLEKHIPLTLSSDTVLITKNGEELSIEDSISPLQNQRGELAGAVIVFHDMTAAREMAKKMEHLAQHDYLTNLPNRLLLNDRIAQAIHLAKRAHHRFALLFLDLDNFKHINDALGHETGDQLLHSVAQRLKSCVRHSDTVSRQGGDEFILLLSSSQFGLDATLTADKILKSLNQPHYIGAHRLQVTASIGISVYPDDGMDAMSLIKSADIAMYGAKESGGNNYKFFRNEMNIRAAQRQTMESGLQMALETQGFILQYQPRVNLANGNITAAEALLRWQHPEWGLTDADKFISIAEDCGLLLPIGEWVLHEACQQAKQWIDAGFTPIPVAVNISSLEFHQTHFVERVRSTLQDTGLAAHFLQLEVNENVLERESDVTTAMLQQLKHMHIKIVLDNYGTGSASLRHLQQYTVDALKIDQRFIHGIHAVKDEAIMVNAILGVADKLNISVIAEGVENRAQLDFLRQNACQEAQGFYFQPALSSVEFTQLLSEHSVN